MQRIYPFMVLTHVLLAACLSSADVHNVTLALSNCGGKEKVSALLEVAKDFVNKGKDLYPNCVGDELNCGKKEKSLAFLEVALKLISEVETSYPTCNATKCPVYRPMDCSEILRSGWHKSGVYTIWPRNRMMSNKSLEVYCDMDTDGGGWTVIQRRGNYSTPIDYFYKPWVNYKDGFGNKSEEFWIGNDNIYAISNQEKYNIRFDLKDIEGQTAYAQYSTFWIEDEAANYTLHINGYTGNGSDSMWMNDNAKFSTTDRVNDDWAGGSCADFRKSGWWFRECTRSNPNGLNQPGVAHHEGMDWFEWKRDSVSMAEIQMKLRPIF